MRTIGSLSAGGAMPATSIAPNRDKPDEDLCLDGLGVRALHRIAPVLTVLANNPVGTLAEAVRPAWTHRP